MSDAARRSAILKRVDQNRTRLARLKSRLPAAVLIHLGRADLWNSEIEALCGQPGADALDDADPDGKRLARAEWQLRVTEDIITSYETQ